MDAAGLEHATKLGQVVSRMDGWIRRDSDGRTDIARRCARDVSSVILAFCLTRRVTPFRRTSRRCRAICNISVLR